MLRSFICISRVPAPTKRFSSSQRERELEKTIDWLQRKMGILEDKVQKTEETVTYCVGISGGLFCGLLYLAGTTHK